MWLSERSVSRGYFLYYFSASITSELATCGGLEVQTGISLVGLTFPSSSPFLACPQRLKPYVCLELYTCMIISVALLKTLCMQLPTAYVSRYAFSSMPMLILFGRFSEDI